MNNTDIDYQTLYNEEKSARISAENLMGTRSKELHFAHDALKSAYHKLKNQNAQLLHQEKLASIGQLAAGVAHEINNPISFVKSNLGTLNNYTNKIIKVMNTYQTGLTTLLSGETIDKETIVRSIQVIEEEIDIDYILDDLSALLKESQEGAERIQSIVEGLKNFSRQDTSELEILDIHECFNNTFRLLNNEIKHKAELVTNFGVIPTLLGHPGSFGQVLLNLVVNACQAIDDFGKITVTTRTFNSSIIITIEDNGKGIEKDDITRIFDPFFTTKEVGEGTGLGLSISHGIIKKHQGVLEVKSDLGRGTCFTITLPMERSEREDRRKTDRRSSISF